MTITRSLYSVSDLADADISSAESRDGRDPNHRHSPHRVLAGDISVSSIPSDSSHGTLRRTHQPEATGTPRVFVCLCSH